MLLLLPPSEGKAAPTAGAPVRLDDLALPELSEDRRQVLSALTQVSASPDALNALGVGTTLTKEVAANLSLPEAPSAPGHQVYTGVLFDALNYTGLTPAAQQRANHDALVFSALFGVTALGDFIPAYRMSIAAKLPGYPGLASWWRPRLSAVLDARAEQRSVVVDCRSGGYAAQWKPPVDKTLTVDVFQLRDGVPKVVSHWAKHTRGLIARILLETDHRQVSTSAGVLAAVQHAGEQGVPSIDAAGTEHQHHWEAELLEATGKKPASLRILLPEVN